MIRRRPTQVFSLAFLDCICCGFGAIILIFVLSIDAKQKDKVKALEELRQALAAQIATIAQIKESKETAEQQAARYAANLVEARSTNATLKSELIDLEQTIQREKTGHTALLVDLDDLRKEIASRQKKSETPELPNVKSAPVGISTDSNYVVFVIDTSGSMLDRRRNSLYSIVLSKIEEVLDVYPEVKGMQFLDSDGNFIIRGTNNRWIDDTRDARESAKTAIRRYQHEANSSPEWGIRRALTTLYKADDPEMKMGLYVFGDEFNGGLANRVINFLERENRLPNGDSKVTINAIGFPTIMEYNPWTDDIDTHLRFANLMREICYRHGGAFIAISELR